MTNLGGDKKGTHVFKNEKDKSQRWGKKDAIYIFKRGEKQILKVRKKLESSSTNIQNEERKSWRWGILIYKKRRKRQISEVKEKKKKKTNLRGERKKEKKTNLRGERKKGEKDESPRWEKSGTEVWAAEAVAPLISLLETLAQICGLIQILILLPALVHWVSFNTPLFIIQSKRVLIFSFFDHHHPPRHHHWMKDHPHLWQSLITWWIAVEMRCGERRKGGGAKIRCTTIAIIIIIVIIVIVKIFRK